MKIESGIYLLIYEEKFPKNNIFEFLVKGGFIREILFWKHRIQFEYKNIQKLLILTTL